MPRKLRAGPAKGGGSEGTDDRDETPPPLTKEQIEGHVSALKSLIKRKEVMDEDLGKPFKEARRTPLTRRIIEFAGLESKMPTNIKLYDGTTDPEDHLSRFASAANSGEWPMPVWCRMFQQTLDGSARGWYSVRRACFKEPYETTKIVRKANVSLTTFKERWMVETSFIMGVPEVMKISSFMDSVKLPELAKLFQTKFLLR
nr:reverse transcriptase domain-containing protein [Tanacetum cinerariifolium]